MATYRSTCVSQHPQLTTVGIYWSKALLSLHAPADNK